MRTSLDAWINAWGSVSDLYACSGFRGNKKVEKHWHKVSATFHYVMNAESTGATWPVFIQPEATIVDYSVKQCIGESLPALLEKSEKFIWSGKWSHCERPHTLPSL